MSAWSYSSAPVWFPTAVATAAGWSNPVTGEVLVAIRNLSNRVTDAAVAVTFTAAIVSAAALVVGQKLIIEVTPSEAIKVAGSLYIPVTVDGVSKQAKYVGMANGKMVFEYTADVAVSAGDVVVAGNIAGSGSVFDDLGGAGQVAVDDLSFTAPDSSAVEISEQE